MASHPFFKKHGEYASDLARSDYPLIDYSPEVIKLLPDRLKSLRGKIIALCAACIDAYMRGNC